MTLKLDAYARSAKELVAAAQSEADQRGHLEVEPIHLLFAMIEGDPTVGKAVESAQVAAKDLRIEVELQLRKLPSSRKLSSYLSPRMLDLLGRAEGEAARAGGAHVSVAHLLIAVAQETDGPVYLSLRACGLSAPILRATLGKQAQASQDASVFTADRAAQGQSDPIEEFGLDLTRMAEQGRFDPLVGRDAELRRILQVFTRRRENNPLLIGERGIGKRTVAHGLAARITKGDVPKMMIGKRIISLEVSALVTGAKLRGQLEERMRLFLNAVRDSGGNILLFIPDIAAFTQRGVAGAGDLLSSALQRQELRALGIATPEQHRRAAEEEPALVERFVPIHLDPPTLDESIGILRGVVTHFEAAHGVRIADPALIAACRLAKRYVPGVQLPKSAIDLIDEAAAHVRVELESVPAELDALERRLETLKVQSRSLEDDGDEGSKLEYRRLTEEIERILPAAKQMRDQWNRDLGSSGALRRIKKELNAAHRELEQARANDAHARAGELRFGTIPLLEKQLAELGVKEPDQEHSLVRDMVLVEDVADVVATWTGVPVSKMMEEEKEKLLRMEERLTKRVVGQEQAVVAVSRAVRRGRVGLRDPKRPIGSFLFLGPTGVGKTELAKTLAEFLFDDDSALTRLDMSEFMEKHMVARLLGSPPGYVHSDQGGFLTEAVRRRPYSVVLFDEMEKAHPDVFNITLQVLDDGRLTDSRGQVAHFADTVIIMTSNV
ncbi:MAG: AAA family ATPase, partial [Myxococcota bacterium]